MRGLLQKRSARWAERAFVAEGAELLRTALRAGVAIESVYLAPEGAGDRLTRETCDLALDAGARVFPLAPGVLERVADTVTPQPVLTVLPMLDAPVPGTDGVPDPAAQPLIIVLVDVRDPGNAGTVLRTADASGVSAVIFSGESVDPYNPKTVRASAGSIFHVPFSVQADPAGPGDLACRPRLSDPGHGGPGRARLRGARLVDPDRPVPGQRGVRPGARGHWRPSAAPWPSRWRAGRSR